MLPGALIGGMLGVQAGYILLSFLGLKTLVTDMATSLPRAARCYARGFKIAWGPTPNDDRQDGYGPAIPSRADVEKWLGFGTKFIQGKRITAIKLVMTPDH